jgi:hypothetical protein
VPLTIGRGWATVDIDRATVELAHLIAADGRFQDVSRSAILGARCVRARAAASVGFGATWVILVEPDTEGRIAAFLARHGEGWAVEWFESEDIAANARGAPGPLGPERLVRDAPTSGPFRLGVPAATIER